MKDYKLKNIKDMKEFLKFIAGMVCGFGLYCLTALPHLLYAVTHGEIGVRYSDIVIYILAFMCSAVGVIIIKLLTDE